MIRRMVRKLSSRSDYAVRTRARPPVARANGIQPRNDTEQTDGKMLREIDDLRLRVRALTATNVNLRRRLKSLEAQIEGTATSGAAAGKSARAKAHIPQAAQTETDESAPTSLLTARKGAIG